MKKWIKVITASFLIYFLLVLMLLMSEQNAEGMIHNFGDAIWYSLVTMTTVGYGDVYPVTAGGKLISSVFLLLSLGLLAFVVNTVFSVMTGKWIPEYKIWRMRKRVWYIFSERNPDAEALAENLSKHHPDALILFCNCSDRCVGNRVAIETDLMEWLQNDRLRRSDCNVFLISDDEGKNRQEALMLTESNCRIYCKSMEVDMVSNVTFFDPQECCARSYWKEYPITKEEKLVILIGDGMYAKAIFHQSVLVNCKTPFQKTAYQLRGDWNTYRQMHPGISAVFSEEQTEGKEVLQFEEKIWNPKKLESADRIILCEDDFEENEKRAIELKRWFAIRGKIYVLGEDLTVPGICFGKKADLFTEESVMKQEQDRAARAMHEAFCRNTGGDMPSWEKLNSFLKASNRAVADHIPVKVQILQEYGKEWKDRDEVLTEMCRRNEHDRWSRFHYMYNWSYAPIRDNELRKHPSLVPFEELSEKEQAKDDLAWEQLSEKDIRKG